MFQLIGLSRQCHAAFIFLWLCSDYVPRVWVHRHDLVACQCTFSKNLCVVLFDVMHEVSTGLRQGSNPRRLRQLRLAIKSHLLNQLRHYTPPNKEFHETMLSLVSLNGPSDRAVLLR